MNLFEYIKSQLPQMPNVQIMKDMGANDELIKYVKKTPWNTNLNILETYGHDGGEVSCEVVFIDASAPFSAVEGGFVSMNAGVNAKPNNESVALTIDGTKVVLQRKEIPSDRVEFFLNGQPGEDPYYSASLDLSAQRIVIYARESLVSVGTHDVKIEICRKG